MSNTKTIGRAALSVLLALMVVSSVLAPFGAFAGTASAQEVVVCEPWSGDSWQSLLNFDVGDTLSSVYCSAAGLFGSPNEASNSVELEEGAYVQHGAMAETANKMHSDIDDKADEWEYMAYADGEQELIEARYNDDSKSLARAEARLAINDAYATQYATLYEGHNNLWRDAFVWGQATTVDPNADTIISVNVLIGGDTLGGQKETTVSFGANSSLVYENVSLPNGDSHEIITRIDDVTVVGDFSAIPPDYDTANLIVADSEPVIEFVDEAGNVDYIHDTDESLDISGKDPNSGATDRIQIRAEPDNYYAVVDWTAKLNADRIDAISDVETRADEVYAEIAAGEVNPADYYGPREFYGDYGSTMETSVAAQLYFHQTVGYETAPDMRMFVNDSGTEYEGGVLVDEASDAPLVYDETPMPLSSTGDVTLDSHLHEGLLSFDANNETSITFVDGSDYDTANLSIDVINVDNETVSVDGSNITATFSESDMQDEEFVIFEVVHNDGSESGTYVLFTDETTTEIRGFVVGETYSGNSMLYLTGSGDIEDRQLSNSWTLERNLDADGNDKAVAVTFEGVDTSFTGTSANDRIEQQQTIKDAVDERDDITDTPAGGSAGDGISSLWAGLGGFALGIVAVMGVGFLLLVLYLVGRVTSVA